MRLYPKDFGQIPFSVPDYAEQQKITVFLDVVDAKLTALRRKRELLQEYKRGMMQKIFYRELRFKRDDGPEFPDWTEKRLGEVFAERNERGFGCLELLSVTVAGGVVKRLELERKDNSSSDKSNYKHVLPKDIAYNSMRMWQGASGVSPYEGVVSPAYTVITLQKEGLSQFFAYYFKWSNVINIFQRFSQGLTSDTWNLKFPAFSKFNC